jgi:predicted O-methyltransferase YrrM
MKNIEEMLETNNWFNYQDFYEKISYKNFSIFVEVGVWKGHSITYLTNKLKENNNIENCKIYAIDLFEDTQDSNIIRDENAKNEIENISKIYQMYLEKTNTRKYINDIKSFSWEAAAKFENNSIDFCFIDADHSYEAVKKDILAWLPKIKNGGIISGHDYSHYHPGVIKAVDEIFNEKTVHNNTVWEVLIK